MIKNPLLIAVIAGIAVAMFQIPIPEIVMKAIKMIAASVTPVVLIVIGLFLGDAKLGKIRQWIPVLFFTIGTLFVLPIMLYAGTGIFGFIPQDFSASIIQAAMPAAIHPFALPKKYDLDPNFIARSIILSTVLSIVTLPFWISLV